MENKEQEKKTFIELSDDLLDHVSGGMEEARNLGDTGIRHILSVSEARGIAGHANGAEISNCSSRLSDETD